MLKDELRLYRKGPVKGNIGGQSEREDKVFVKINYISKKAGVGKTICIILEVSPTSIFGLEWSY